MVNASLELATPLGLILLILGLMLPFLRRATRQPLRTRELLQDSVLALVYAAAGGILFFQGWRLDPLLQFSQLLFVGSSFYWVIKDLTYHS